MPSPSRDVPPRFNLQQRWPAEERAWLKAEAKRIGVTETDLLVALVRREADRSGEIGVAVDDYLPPPSPRSERGRRMRRERKAREEAERAALPPPVPKTRARMGRPPKPRPAGADIGDSGG